MATNSIPQRGAKLLAVSGQEDKFVVYGDVSKTSDSRRATEFDRVVSAGTISTDTTGSVWLKVFGYKYDKKDGSGYVLVDDHDTIWVGQPFISKPAPEIPSSIKIELLYGGKGVLSWAPIADAAVEIESALTSQGPFNIVAISSVGGGSYDINHLAKGITAHYRLRSTNDYGESQYSNVVSATATDAKESTVTASADTTVAMLATPATQSKASQSIDKSDGDDTDVIPTETELPIIKWVRENPVFTLTISAGVVVALMMIIVAGRRS